MTRADWRLVWLSWAAVATIFAVRTILQYDAVPLLGDGDDAMRMVTATDLLNGQAWQDPIQYRDNAPYGIEMHWSRLVDAPIALLMALAKPIFGVALAPDIAAIAWPLIMLLPLMALLAATSRRLMPDADLVPAVILPVLGLVVLIEFLPGRVDHHSVQILLSLATILALIAARDRWTGAVVAGLTIATSLAIGLETIPFAFAGIAIYALLWVDSPRRYRGPLMMFAAVLGVATVLHFVIATAPSRYLVAACDALSIVFVGAIGTASAAMLIGAAFLTRLPNRGLRFVTLAGLGVAALAPWATLYPQCLQGPYYAVDPRVFEAVFVGIAEMQSLPERLSVDPATGIAFALAALLALPVGIRRIIRETGERRVDWLVLTLFLALADIIMFSQMRGARFAGAFAVPMGVWLITAARNRYLARRTASGIAGLLGAWLLFAGVAQYALVSFVSSYLPPAHTDGPEAAGMREPKCLLQSDYKRLATLPPGIVMAPLRMGAHMILRYTPHSIVSAGFHRNNQGSLDVVAFFAGPDEMPRAIAARRGLTYVVTCGAPPMTEDWLTPLSPADERLQIYRISQ